MLKLSTMALIPLACLIFVFIIWLKYGREKKVIETVEFYPPEGKAAEKRYSRPAH